MKKRYILYILFGWFPLSFMAQAELDTLISTYTLGEVRVVADRSIQTSSTEDVSIFKLRTLQWATIDLGSFMDKNGLANVLSNGATGMASSARYRGLSSDHLSMNWHGVPMNSISLGTSDMSMIPIFFFDQATFYSSPGTQSLAGSNLGMAVNLSSDYSLVNESYISIYSSFNSLMNSFQGLKIRQIFRQSRMVNRAQNNTSFRDGFLISSTKLFYQNINNDFAYKDVYRPESPVIRQVHNGGMNEGLHQDLEWHWNKNVLEGHIWYQKKAMQLPATMGSYSAGTAQQNDELLRSAISFVHSGKKDSLRLVCAFMDEALHYRDRKDDQGKWMIDSRIQSRVLFNGGNYHFQWSKHIGFHANAAFVKPEVTTSNYQSGNGRGHWAQAGSGVSIHANNNIIEADIRQDFRNTKTLPSWTFNYQQRYEIETLSLTPGIQISRRYRVPDMNELYWSPGGNSHLKPESGLSYKGSFQLKWHRNGKQIIATNTQIFYSEIKNWIQWIPMASGIWSPINYKIVRTRGVEIPIEYDFIVGSVDVDITARYQFTQTRAVNADQWSDANAFKMIYTPEHISTLMTNASRGHFKMGISVKHTSTRYTDESNSALRSLDPFMVSGVNLGYSWKKQMWMFQCSADISNIFNVAYESVRTYAMPGRVIQLNLQIKLLIRKKKEL